MSPTPAGAARGVGKVEVGVRKVKLELGGIVGGGGTDIFSTDLDLIVEAAWAVAGIAGFDIGKESEPAAEHSPPSDAIGEEAFPVVIRGGPRKRVVMAASMSSSSNPPSSASNSWWKFPLSNSPEESTAVAKDFAPPDNAGGAGEHFLAADDAAFFLTTSDAADPNAPSPFRAISPLFTIEECSERNETAMPEYDLSPISSSSSSSSS
mmetsp:Transcript_56842/g.84543  ORF Transcript_56842/g.84543 Transcript_56842/m.84543 type:complete len:208 (+) Transcript_56842:4268-4891(+)